MDIKLSVAIIAGAASIAGAVLALSGQIILARYSARQKVEERRVESEKVISRYREPLARAAYDLQSRLYNILEHGLIFVYLNNGNERERGYVVDNTAFLIAQFFWLD